MDADPRVLDSLRSIEAGVGRLAASLEHLTALVDEWLTTQAATRAQAPREHTEAG